MTERASELGGWCTKEHSSTGGTLVEAWLPISIEGSAGMHDPVSDAVVTLLNMWSYASVLGSRERGGRTRLQKGDNQPNPPTTYLLHVWGKPQQISADSARS